MFQYNPFNYTEFANIVNSCVLRAKEASNLVEDKGYANNDMLVLTFLNNQKEKDLIAAGLDVEKRKGAAGHYWLNVRNGQAERNTTFCRELTEMLRVSGILSTIVYQSD